MKLRNELRAARQQAGLAQGTLAARAGISRQTLSSLESGASEPSMGVALRLARALGRGVEELFRLDDAAGLEVEVARGQALAPGARVVLGRVEGKWSAHPLAADNPASFAVRGDGLVERARGGRARVRLLADPRSLEETTLLCGCEPALGLLAGRAQRDGARFVWVPAPSEQALAAMAGGTAHIAGLHLFDEPAGEYNAPFVLRAAQGRPMLVITLAQVATGLLVARRNPKRIRGVADLAQREVQIVNREKGAGARQLLDRLLRGAGLRGRELRGYGRCVSGHMQVAQEVASGAADAGIATESAAIAHGLSFIPLAEERFDLALTEELSRAPRIARMLEELQGLAFRRELQSLGGYDASRAGQIVAGPKAA